MLIEDLDGASHEKTFYGLRELMSKQHISKTLALKDQQGNLKTITLQVEGPICLAGTTTREKLYEDNANRSILIYLDNSAQHNQAIMDYQRALSAGTINKQQEQAAINLLQAMQTQLKPIAVRNPYATQLVLPQQVFKPLRTNAHYLAFIETITFYHQHQRSVKTDPNTQERYIETTLDDIKAANALLKDVLLAKSDELTGATRQFLAAIQRFLNKENKTSFYSRALRCYYRLAPTTMNRHLCTLVRYNYLRIVSGSRAKGYEYELSIPANSHNLANQVNDALGACLARLQAEQPKQLVNVAR